MQCLFKHLYLLGLLFDFFYKDTIFCRQFFNGDEVLAKLRFNEFYFRAEDFELRVDFR